MYKVILLILDKFFLNMKGDRIDPPLPFPLQKKLPSKSPAILWLIRLIDFCSKLLNMFYLSLFRNWIKGRDHWTLKSLFNNIPFLIDHIYSFSGNSYRSTDVCISLIFAYLLFWRSNYSILFIYFFYVKRHFNLF